MIVRSTTRSDLAGLKDVLDGTGLFPPEMLPEMVAPFLEGSADSEQWLTVETDGAVTGFCYAVKEKLTEGTWNMLALAVNPSAQGTGLGRALVEELERRLSEAEQKTIIVDTSGSSEFEGTRKFYARVGYTEEARIRDFWAVGDDKVVFWKTLIGAND